PTTINSQLSHSTPPCLSIYKICIDIQDDNMATEAPSWADQWGAGGIGAMEEDDSANTKRESSGNKKGNAKAGLNKAKATAMVGALKIKSGASAGIKWVKNQCQKKGSPK
ncbi:hypothetical protein F2P56_006670, partial [Juglans regia]